jgi:hypothetical protein
MDCAFAVAVYGREGGVMSELRELKAWFEARTVFHFYSAPILLGYCRCGFMTLSLTPLLEQPTEVH